MRRVDYPAVLADFEACLLERPSWGRGQLLELLAELKRDHSVEESADEAVLRRFSAHLTDTFFGVSPRPDVPLVGDDRETSQAMGGTVAHAMT
jgi:hypothetical protein